MAPAARVVVLDADARPLAIGDRVHDVVLTRWVAYVVDVQPHGWVIAVHDGDRYRTRAMWLRYDPL